MKELEFSGKSKIQSSNSKIEDIRVLLWDIDGTLLQSNLKGSYKIYFGSALKKVFGTSGNILNVDAAGATDSQIIFKSLESEGFTVEDVFSKLDEFTEVLCSEMNSFIDQNKNVFEILPGVREILENTTQNPRFLNSLLTGNLRCGAESKLNYIDLWHYFQEVPHAYGDISHDRRELGKAAEKKINQFLDINLKPEQFIIIGDTPNDILAARAFGAKVIAVGTGRGIEFNDLESQNPDVYFEDLSDSKAFFQILENL